MAEYKVELSHKAVKQFLDLGVTVQDLVYAVSDELRTVEVVRIANRRDVYKLVAGFAGRRDPSAVYVAQRRH